MNVKNLIFIEFFLLRRGLLRQNSTNIQTTIFNIQLLGMPQIINNQLIIFSHLS